MFTGLFWPAVLAAVVDWLAVWRGWERVRWVTKPGTLILLIAWFSSVGGWAGPLALFGVGLVFSLLGDVFLMLPAQFFLAGGGAFFAAHGFYIAGFSSQPLSLRAEAALPVLAVAGVYVLVNGRIQAGIREQKQTQMSLPVALYAGVISLMLLMALSTFARPAWGQFPALLVSLGAGLFFISDSILAFDRFAKPIRFGDMMVMVTYHLGQFCIAAGVLAQFAGK